MRMKYITTTGHAYSEEKHGIVRKDFIRLGYVINEHYSVYQNYNPRSGTVGYWHVIHNNTGMSVGMVKTRKDALQVIAQYDLQLFDYATVNAHGFIDWTDRSAKVKQHATWQTMRESGLIVL